RREGHDEQTVPGVDELLLGALSEERAVHAHRCQREQCREGRHAHEHEVDDDLVPAELVETLLEGDREQEAREDLRARLHDAELLQHLCPVAVESLVLALVATVSRCSVVITRHALTLGHARRADIVSAWQPELSSSTTRSNATRRSARPTGPRRSPERRGPCSLRRAALSRFCLSASRGIRGSCSCPARPGRRRTSRSCFRCSRGPATSCRRTTWRVTTSRRMRARLPAVATTTRSSWTI